jgi:hypothetical protein
VAEEAGSTYKVAGYADSWQHLIISRETPAGRCTKAQFRVVIPREGVLRQLPTDGGAERAGDGRCGESDEALRREPIGVLGSVIQPDNVGCVFDFDYTLFFLGDDGLADAVRFKAERVRIAGCSQ